MDMITGINAGMIAETGVIVSVIGVILTLVALYHCRIRTRRWFSFFPVSDFNKNEMKLWLSGVGIMIAGMIIFVIFVSLYNSYIDRTVVRPILQKADSKR